MVKYGKEFRKNQIGEWKEKYFNYKAQKQKIKNYLRMRNEIPQDKEIITLREELDKWSVEFGNGLDKEMKKVYIFFVNKEKLLYKKINQFLHLKEEYTDLSLDDYLNQYEQLEELSELSVNMSNFTFVNLKALIKILKKFDKKIITSQNKDLYIKINYIQTKIEEQNSDILYLLKFKMIDEVNVILEDIINSLMKKFKSNKNRLGKEQENDTENKLIEEATGINEASAFIKQKHEQIKKNIQKVDQVSAEVNKLFLPWKDFLRISTDAGSKFIQIQKESSINDNNTSFRNQSIIQSISFSRESKYNIFIVLFHGMLYMFSFSVIIPTYTSIISYFGEKGSIDGPSKYWGILMMMAPLGTLINYLYETFFFKRSTKKPIIISCIGIIIGNILYVIAPSLNIILFLFIGRFICGLFNLRTHNKMYIINFLMQKDVSFYLTMFHTFSTLGLAIGFIINSGLLFIPSSNILFNKSTVGPLVTVLFSLALLIATLLKFTEAHSKAFSITSMQMFGEGIMSEDDDKEINGINSDGEDYSKRIKSQTIILKDIDSQLGNFNKQSNFDDTNLVQKSVHELANKEEEGLHSLLNVFIVYLIVIFTTKFINESLFINSHIFMKDIIEKDDRKVSWLIPLVLGISCFMILFIELALSCKHKFISERKLIIILLLLLLINNALFICFHYLNIKHYIIIATETVIASVTEKYVAHLFLYIIPENYIICRIHGNVLINIFSMISRVLCSGLLILLDTTDINIFNVVVYSVMTCLSFISLLLYFIFYKDIRIKAINRIIKSNPSDEIKIATEV